MPPDGPAGAPARAPRSAGQPLGAIQLLSGATPQGLELTKPLTRSASPGHGASSRAGAGYFITHVEGAARPTVTASRSARRPTRSRSRVIELAGRQDGIFPEGLNLRQHLARIAMASRSCCCSSSTRLKVPTRPQAAVSGALDNILYDTRLNLAMPRGVDPSIVILDIDDAAWARSATALEPASCRADRQAVRSLRRRGAAFDIVWAERDTSSESTRSTRWRRRT